MSWRSSNYVHLYEDVTFSRCCSVFYRVRSDAQLALQQPPRALHSTTPNNAHTKNKTPSSPAYPSPTPLPILSPSPALQHLLTSPRTHLPHRSNTNPNTHYLRLSSLTLGLTHSYSSVLSVMSALQVCPLRAAGNVWVSTGRRWGLVRTPWMEISWPT